MDTRIQGLRSFLDAAHSNYHAVSYLEAQLKQKTNTMAVFISQKR